MPSEDEADLMKIKEYVLAKSKIPKWFEEERKQSVSKIKEGKKKISGKKRNELKS